MITRCTHLKISGARCTMPAVNGKELCFHHESRLLRMRVRPSPPSTWATVPLLSFVYPEDHAAILENIHAIARAFAHQLIDYRQASVLDRLMNTALKTLRQGRKLEDAVTSEEMIRHFRLDPDGNARALPDSPEPSTEPSPAPAEPAPAAEPAPETGGVIPNIAAVADDENEVENEEVPPSNQILVATLPSPQLHLAISSAISTLAKSMKLKSAFSYTYISRRGKLRSVPNDPSKQPGSSRHAGSAANTARFISNCSNLA